MKKMLHITSHQESANENHNRDIISHLLECLSSKILLAFIIVFNQDSTLFFKSSLSRKIIDECLHF